MLSSCGTKGGRGTGMFEMNSDKITISTSDGAKIDIIDKAEIKKIRNLCINYNWKEVPKEKQLDGTCDIWIDFNNNWAIIGMYKDKDYGNLEKTKEKIGTPMYLPKGLNKYIQKLLEKTGANNKD